MSNYGMGNTTLETTRTTERVLFSFAGIALFNAIELLVAILVRFRQRRGLYFWSLVVATTGIFPYTLGLLFKFFGVIKGYPAVFGAIAMIDIGWQTMVTGQSVVLYSRLHLVCRRPKVLRIILWTMISNWFVSNVPTTVFVFGASSAHPGPYLKPYGIWERIQLSLYFVQELVISGLYVYEVVGMLKPDTGIIQERKRGSIFSGHGLGRRWKSDSSRRVLRHLIWINILIVALDVSLLVAEFIGHYEIQVVYKALVYSIKLKLEFRILNQLTDIASEGIRSSQAYFNERSQSLGSECFSSLATNATSAEQRRVSNPRCGSPHDMAGDSIGSEKRKDVREDTQETANNERKLSAGSAMSQLGGSAVGRVVSFQESKGNVEDIEMCVA